MFPGGQSLGALQDLGALRLKAEWKREVFAFSPWRRSSSMVFLQQTPFLQILEGSLQSAAVLQEVGASRMWWPSVWAWCWILSLMLMMIESGTQPPSRHYMPLLFFLQSSWVLQMNLSSVATKERKTSDAAENSTFFILDPIEKRNWLTLNYYIS